eukprot:549767-Prorocentrum_minimum.AAC.1
MYAAWQCHSCVKVTLAVLVRLHTRTSSTWTRHARRSQPSERYDFVTRCYLSLGVTVVSRASRWLWARPSPPCCSAMLFCHAVLSCCSVTWALQWCHARHESTIPESLSVTFVSRVHDS